jgi:hypothetical protein
LIQSRSRCVAKTSQPAAKCIGCIVLSLPGTIFGLAVAYAFA